MTLTRPTIKDVERYLKDGNYTRAADLAESLSPGDPMVTLLARELASVGNRNRNGRGPRRADLKPTPPDAVMILCASMLHADLLRAGEIFYGRKPCNDDEQKKKARELIKKHKLHKVDKWQQFKVQARTAAAKDCEVAEEKIWR